MKDIVDRLEKRAKYLWRIIFISYLILADLKFKNDENSYIFVGVWTACFLFDYLIGYFIRTMYKIEPSAIVEIVQSIGIMGIQNGMTTYAYSEDYIRSYRFIPDESKPYTYYKLDRHGFNTSSEYTFHYISLYNKAKHNTDKIEVYKILNRYHKNSTDNLRKLHISIRLELSYINNKFVLKNHYSKESFDSLKTDEAFTHFYQFIENIKVLFDPNDFYNFMKDSSFELELSSTIKRNLLKKTLTDGTKYYHLNVKWADNIGSLKLGRFRKYFEDGEVIRFCDYTGYFEDHKKRNKPVPEWVRYEKYYFSKMFNYMLYAYQNNSQEVLLKYTNPEDVETWKKMVIKKRLKMKTRIVKLKNKIKQRTYKVNALTKIKATK